MTAETSPLLRSDSNGTSSAQYGIGEIPGHIDESPRPEVASLSYFVFLIPMGIGVFLSAMDQTIVVSSYAAIGSDLKQLQNTSWLATAYMMTLTSFQPLYGKMSDIFGRKECLLFSYTIFALGCLACGMARNMTELTASRAFAGIGGGGMTTVASIVLSDVVPLRSRGTWQGIINIVFSLGSATGAPLGGFLVDTIGWRWSFFIQVPVAILAITSVSLALHLPKGDPSEFSSKIKRVDFTGALALIITIFSLLFGLDRGGNISWGDTLTRLSLGSFAFMLALFWYIETRVASEPFAPGRIILSSSFIGSYLVNFFGLAAAMNSIFYVSLYLQAVQGKTASASGLWLVLSVFGGLSGSLGGGLIMQATGKYYLLTVAAYGVFVIGSVVILLMAGLVADSTIGIGIGLVLASIGNGAGITTSLISLIANAGQEDQAIATAVSYLFRSLGGVIGVSIGSTLVQETLQSYLHSHLFGTGVEEIILRVRESLSFIDTLDPKTQVIVRSGYGQAVQVSLSFMLIMAVLSFVASFFIREKPLSRK